LELRSSLNYRLFLVTIPRELSSEEEARKEIKDFITPFEQVIDKFSHYKKNIVLELVNPYDSDEIRFYLAINRADADLLVKVVSSLYPRAQIEPTEEYTIFSPQGKNIGGIVSLKENFVLPIKSFYEAKEDPFATVVNALSKTARDEGVGLQIIFRAEQNKKEKFLQSVRKNLLEGKSLKEALAAPKVVIEDTFKKTVAKTRR